MIGIVLSRQTGLAATARFLVFAGMFLGVSLLSGAAIAGAAPRFYTKSPNAALALAETRANRIAGYSDAKCWFHDGNATIGWRKASCTFNYNNAGTTYRGKVTDTLLSCQKESEYTVVPGVGRARRTTVVHWKRDHLTCKRS